MEQRLEPALERWRQELRLGLERMREGEFSRAETHFERAHGEAPAQPEICYALGDARMRQHRAIEAEVLLRTAWLGDPSLVSAAAALARCLAIHLDRLEDAQSILDQATASHGSLPLLEVVRAEILLDAGQLEPARQAIQAALSSELPLSESTAAAARAARARIDNQEGLALAEDGELEAALFAFKRAADSDAKWSSPLVNMGAVFSHLGKPVRARRAFVDAIAIDPENPTAHHDLGLSARNAGELELARHHLQAAVDLDPDLDDARTALAELRLAAGDHDSACALLSERLERAPSDPRAWSELGTALAAAGDRAGAENCFREAIDLDPEHADGCHRLADLLTRDGRYIEAAQIAERARDLNPMSTP